MHYPKVDKDEGYFIVLTLCYFVKREFHVKSGFATRQNIPLFFPSDAIARYNKALKNYWLLVVSNCDQLFSR